ncbi:hypothetical protein ACFYW6_39965 [Streptomyces sp. NPDC002659]|uniref:hypothetical protein n=1 Tax=Streptomyces sp. NPDC002659 TaxID=3364656 RepID=UPI0036C40D26
MGAKLMDRYRGAFESLARGLGPAEQARVTVEMFVNFMGAALAGRPEVFDRGMRPIAELIVDILDIDRDNHLDESDFRRFLSAYSIPELEAILVMRHLEVEFRGLLPREKFVEYSRDFYCGDDPSSPGNWLFGNFNQIPYGADSAEAS